MPSRATKIRLFVVGLALAAGATLALARWALLPWALDAALRAGGASEVSFDLTRASPWRVQVEDVAFNLDATRIAAQRASLERRHWWSPSLGRLSVSAARVELDLAAGIPESGGSAAEAAPAEAPRLPLEEISVDGLLTVRAGAEDGPSLAVRFEARPDAQAEWTGTVNVAAPGLVLAAAGRYAPARTAAEFRTTSLELDLQAAQPWLARWAPWPDPGWTCGGKIEAAVSGRWDGEGFAATGDVHLRDGLLANAGKELRAEEIQIDAPRVDFVDLNAADVQVRARTATVGRIALTDLHAQLATATAGRFEVTAMSARALGGELHVEPLVFRPADPVIDAVIRAEGVRAEQILALTEDLPARASGALSGRLPVRYADGSVRLGTGWLGLAAGGSLELQLQAEGLLTGGTSPQSANYAVLKQVEDGMMKLKVTALRLDVRPPGAPAGRTAQLHLSGAPADPNVKAPITLDLNVNGPIESLLNLGLKTGAGAGTNP